MRIWAEKLSKRVFKSQLTIEPLTKKLGSNPIAQIIPRNSLNSSTSFLPEQIKSERRCETGISEKSYPLMHQHVFGHKVFIFSELYYLEPGLYHSITDVVQTIRMLAQDRPLRNKSSDVAKESPKTQKVGNHLGIEKSGLAFFSTVLG